MGLYDQARGSGLPFIANLLAQVEATGWGNSNNHNQIWGGHFNNANIIINAAWGDSVDTSPTNLPRIPGRPHAAQCCVREYFLHHRR